ncbi:MAG TPA: DUF222 domain-containing protein [Pseudonocardia sp.]|uniref:HNH endonuclease signature motif containing protein n=1 Tax=Pseudonocardia sp. TaxID=60912 RepID=UPI002B8FF71D|nr:DUF222 domain-containing protein [Pseudonocardia sp.]HTF54044.1 DUF222 domain-containing protein [Pseudonocardia sp.]
MLVEQVPDDLEEIPPGPELAALLASLNISRVACTDLPIVLQAQSRQRSHDEAQFLRVIAEMGRRDPFADSDMVASLDEQARYAADELRVALTWTRRAAEATQAYADDLIFHLPQVHTALTTGHIDPAKARVFHRHLHTLASKHVESLCTDLLPLAGGLTTGQLDARLWKAVLAVDPERARKEYERAVTERSVIAYLNPDGTVTLTAQGLPAHEAAAACERIHHLAKQVKRAGHPATLDQIKADVMLGLLNRRFDDMTVTQIITTMTSDIESGQAQSSQAQAGQAEAEPGQAPAGTDHASQPATPTQPYTSTPPNTSRQPNPPTPPNTPAGPCPGPPVEPDSQPARPAEPTTSQTAAPGDPAPDSATRNPRGRLAGIEVSVQLATLLGRNDHPATIPGLGPVLADVARRIVASQRGAQWRYTLLNPDGHFVFGGITRRRPTATSNHSHGGIIELLIPTDLLAELTHHPPDTSEWTQIIADIATQYREHTQQLRDIDADPDRRFPTAALRRHIQQRDRACVGPGCRRPASKSEFDHTWEYQHHGPTTSTNGGPVCKHDHNLKSEGGWTLHQPKPSEFIWHTPFGQTHRSRGEPILHPLPTPDQQNADPPPF